MARGRRQHGIAAAPAAAANGGGVDALVPDAGAANDVGGDVSGQRVAHPTDHGAPSLLRSHGGQEHLLLVPEAQGPHRQKLCRRICMRQQLLSCAQ